MADMPSDFWSGWIAVITVVSLMGLGWLVFSIYFTPKREEHVSPVWDESLIEGDSPAPMWWFWLIFILMVFSVLYLMLYPGLGSYKGALKWSHGTQLGESYALHDYEFSRIRQRLLDTPFTDLQADGAAMRSAAGIFSRNCAACHGPEGAGQANLFPNLTDAAWQWGGTPEAIAQSIRQGRQASMPAWDAVISATDQQALASFVADFNVAADHPGKALYGQFCAACHGPDGKGNPALGAPDLTDDAWLYGPDEAAILRSIAAGRNGEMPAFGDRLDEVQLRLLVAWLTR